MKWVMKDRGYPASRGFVGGGCYCWEGPSPAVRNNVTTLVVRFSLLQQSCISKYHGEYVAIP